jgi:SNF2 family DNA or RNA helicase
LRQGEPYLFKFQALITTYEMVNADHAFLSRVPWQYVVVDEAHRLKNKDCKLTEELRAFQTEHWLLLTGTPLQNNTEELWSLLNLMNPTEFGDLEVSRLAVTLPASGFGVITVRSLIMAAALRRRSRRSSAT